MITVNIDPIAFSIGALNVRWYGMMYVVGIMVAFLTAWPYAKWKGFTEDELERIVIWAVPAGLVGARLYYVVQQPLGQYFSDPLGIFAFWEGGMAWYGAVFGVVLTLLILGWRMRISILKMMDVAAIMAVVGQFFGRIGNFINGDVVGYQTTLPWGVVYANPNSFTARHDVAYQPAAVYEAIIDVLLFGVLWFFRKKVKSGMLFFIYIISYSISQIIVFTWRDNEVVFLGLKQAQLTAIGVIIAAVVVFAMIVLRQRKQAKNT